MKQTGSCACGAFKYEVSSEPKGVAACHCKACQRRTGSAFGMGVFFNAKNVEILSGNYGNYMHTADSGRSKTNMFCKSCGTTVMWTAEAMPDGIAIAGGTFDDTAWIQPKLHAWASQSHAWFTFPEDIPVLQTSPGDIPVNSPPPSAK